MDSDDPTQPLQLLTPDGTLVDNPWFPWEGSDEDLVDMLRQMTTARRFNTVTRFDRRALLQGASDAIAGNERGLTQHQGDLAHGCVQLVGGCKRARPVGGAH